MPPLQKMTKTTSRRQAAQKHMKVSGLGVRSWRCATSKAARCPFFRQLWLSLHLGLLLCVMLFQNCRSHMKRRSRASWKGSWALRRPFQWAMAIPHMTQGLTQGLMVRLLVLMRFRIFQVLMMKLLWRQLSRLWLIATHLIPELSKSSFLSMATCFSFRRTDLGNSKQYFYGFFIIRGS